MSDEDKQDGDVLGIEINVELGGDFSIDDVFPDDPPEKPTLDDVVAALKESGSVHRLISDWNMDMFADVTVAITIKDSTSPHGWQTDVVHLNECFEDRFKAFDARKAAQK